MAVETVRESTQEYKERVITVNRVAKVVKGGRRFKFSAVAVVGDGNGKVGVGFGKASEAPAAIRKAIEKAYKSIFTIPLHGTTIPHAIRGRSGAGIVLMKPASRGTGVIAGGAVRAIVEAAGIKDILAKRLGSANALSVVNATLDGLKKIKDPARVAELRGKNAEELGPPEPNEEEQD